MFILLFLVSNTFGQTLAPDNSNETSNKIVYEFDSFEVVYAAKFSTTMENWVENSWSTDIASKGKDVEVLYGIVKFTDKSGYDMYEGFIKVSGDLGSQRYLLNSFSLRAENESYSEFSAHKTFSEKGKSIIKLDRDENNILALTMTFDGDKLVKGYIGFDFRNDIYPEKDLKGSTYNIDINTFKSEGKRDYLN